MQHDRDGANLDCKKKSNGAAKENGKKTMSLWRMHATDHYSTQTPFILQPLELDAHPTQFEGIFHRGATRIHIRTLQRSAADLAGTGAKRTVLAQYNHGFILGASVQGYEKTFRTTSGVKADDLLGDVFFNMRQAKVLTYVQFLDWR